MALKPPKPERKRKSPSEPVLPGANPAVPHAVDPGDSLPFAVVAIGASAGGLEAFRQLLEALPDDTGMAFVLLQHMVPTHESLLSAILTRSTKMPVREAAHNTKVEPDHVYVIPPAKDLVFTHGLLQLRPRTESSGQHRPIDHFMRSLAEAHGYKVEWLEESEGEGAGIKSATVVVKGHNAYGWLKNENGVHRLGRISPFDANKRRHTSFASVFVYPVVDDTIQIEIRDDDIEMDVYRASGAGGQHVNKTSSAVRLRHLPSGIVVACQQERSQHKNKAVAMKMLKAALYQRAIEEREKKKAQLESTKTDISWGNQIRSYVFQPYTMVNDHRTELKAGDVQAVMDGEIDEFIEAYLKRFGGKAA